MCRLVQERGAIGLLKQVDRGLSGRRIETERTASVGGFALEQPAQAYLPQGVGREVNSSLPNIPGATQTAAIDRDVWQRSQIRPHFAVRIQQHLLIVRY